MKRRLLIAGLVAALLVAAVVIEATGTFGGNWGCSDDGLDLPRPDGWDWARDGDNGCEWTLFNDQGDRAPEELYADTGIEYPGSPLLYFPRLAAIIIALGSLIGLAWLSVSRRRIQLPAP